MQLTGGSRILIINKKAGAGSPTELITIHQRTSLTHFAQPTPLQHTAPPSRATHFITAHRSLRPAQHTAPFLIIVSRLCYREAMTIDLNAARHAKSRPPGRLFSFYKPGSWITPGRDLYVSCSR